MHKRCVHLCDTGKESYSGAMLVRCNVRDITMIGSRPNVCRHCAHFTESQEEMVNETRPGAQMVRDEPPEPHENMTEYERALSMTFIDTTSLHRCQDGTFYIYRYHPERRGMNPAFDEVSNKILSVKCNDDDAISTFARAIDERMNDDADIVICVIPSHEQGLNESGIRTIAKRLCKNDVIDGTECLLRRRTIKTKHRGGHRDLSDEIDSLVVQKADLIQDRIVLLLDDIYTTGTSVRAGRNRLKESGARYVLCLVLGRTVRE